MRMPTYKHTNEPTQHNAGKSSSLVISYTHHHSWPVAHQRVPFMYRLYMFRVGASHTSRPVYNIYVSATPERSHCVRADPRVVHLSPCVEVAEPYPLAGLECRLCYVMPPIILIFVRLRAAESMLLGLLKNGGEETKFFRHVVVGIPACRRPR